MPHHINRRTVLTGGVAALATALSASDSSGPGPKPVIPTVPELGTLGPVVNEQPFARLETVGDGIWAVISTPLNASGAFAHPETLCNGGLIMGDDHVVAVEGFYTPPGAAWLSDQSLKLTGKRPTHVIVTHLHLDHCGGLAGFQDGAVGPDIIMTERTRTLINESYGGSKPDANDSFAKPAGRLVGPTLVIHDETRTHQLDIGGRTLTLHPLSGHSPSDLAVSITDSDILFAGDLIWGGFFPNFISATPLTLRPSCEALFAMGDRRIITGHGYSGHSEALRGPFLALLDSVEHSARNAVEKGQSVREATGSYQLPEIAADWQFFNPAYVERALGKWFDALASQQG